MTERLPTAVQRFASFGDERQLRRFLQAARELDPDGDQRPYFLSRAWLHDEIVAEVAASFYEEVDPTLAIVHFQSLDWSAHHFLYFDQPRAFDRFEWDRETSARLDSRMSLYRNTVDSFHRYVDDWLGRLVAMTDESTGIILLSDHGTGPGPDPDLPGYHDDAPPGIIVLSGPGIRRGQRIDGATVYDVLPTLMAGLEAPLARDLPGRVLEEAFCPESWTESRQRWVASYRSGNSFVPQVSTPNELESGVSSQLEALGYLD